MAFLIFDALYGLVDMFWVARLTHESFYAVSVTAPLFVLICSFGDSVGQGVNSIMSRFIGFGDYEGSYNSLIHGLIVIAAIWILCLLSMLFFNNIMVLMKINQSLDLVFAYIMPLFVCSIVFLLENFFAETMQAEGDSKTPTYVMLGANVLNLVLGPIFIFTLGMEVLGAAVATILAALVAVVVMFYWYYSGRTKVPLSLEYFKNKPKIYYEILKVAIPNFFDNAIWCIYAVFLNGILIEELGTRGIVLYATSVKIKDLLIAPVKGYGRGLMSVTRHLFGAKEVGKLRDMYKYVLIISLLTSVVISIIFLFMRNLVFESFKIMNMEASVLGIAFFGIFILLSIPVSIISSKMLDGFGKSYYSLALTLIKMALETVMILSLRPRMGYGISIIVSIALNEIIQAILNFVILFLLLRNFESKDKDDLVVV